MVMDKVKLKPYFRYKKFQQTASLKNLQQKKKTKQSDFSQYPQQKNLSSA